MRSGSLLKAQRSEVLGDRGVVSLAPPRTQFSHLGQVVSPDLQALGFHQASFIASEGRGIRIQETKPGCSSLMSNGQLSNTVVPSWLCFWIFMTQSRKKILVRKLLGDLIVYPLAIWESIFLTGELIRDIIINSMQLNISIKRVVVTLGSVCSYLRVWKLLLFCGKSKALEYKT